MKMLLHMKKWLEGANLVSRNLALSGQMLMEISMPKNSLWHSIIVRLYAK